ncbi:MAG: ShlB/FhaC/HecB family hemolysin secretion/activation protein [Pseudomonadota bacterium]
MSKWIALGLIAASQGALALPPSVASGQLQQIPPAPPPPKAAPVLPSAPPAAASDLGAVAGERIVVTALRVTGQTLFAEDRLIAETGFTPGSSLSLAELRALAARISAYYNDRGYFLARAYLPAQDIAGGAVTIAVIEGRYGAVRVTNSTHLKDGVSRRILRGLDQGDVITDRPLERRLLLLSDIPGVAVQSTLTPGAAVGTSDLIVDVTPGRRVTGSVEADNAGNRYTGTYRAGGSLYLNNPTGAGDLISLRVLGSSSGLAYGRAAYQVPVGNLTVGASYAHIRYDLGREFTALDADGTADIASVFASYPLVRSRNANLYAVATLDAKWFKDRVRAIPATSRKRSNVLTLGLNGDSHDLIGGGGWNAGSIGWSIGDLKLRSPLDRAVDAMTARSAGGFGKVQFSAARLQAISGPLTLYGSIRGQYAFNNLDSSEKMELGGAYGVRAYPEGEAYGDQGYIATAETRLMLSHWMPRFPGQLQAIGFIDVGRVDFAHDPWFTTSNHANRSAIGAGLTWFAPRDLILRATYATKLGSADATAAPDKSGRFWFQVVKLF